MSAAGESTCDLAEADVTSSPISLLRLPLDSQTSSDEDGASQPGADKEDEDEDEDEGDFPPLPDDARGKRRMVDDEDGDDSDLSEPDDDNTDDELDEHM